MKIHLIAPLIGLTMGALSLSCFVQGAPKNSRRNVARPRTEPDLPSSRLRVGDKIVAMQGARGDFVIDDPRRALKVTSLDPLTLQSDLQVWRPGTGTGPGKMSILSGNAVMVAVKGGIGKLVVLRPQNVKFTRLNR